MNCDYWHDKLFVIKRQKKNQIYVNINISMFALEYFKIECFISHPAIFSNLRSLIKFGMLFASCLIILGWNLVSHIAKDLKY